MDRPESKTTSVPSEMPFNFAERRRWQDEQRERGELPRCGRSACQRLITGEVWVNKGTPLLYCGYCAMLINRQNPGQCSPEVDRLKLDPPDNTNVDRPSLSQDTPGSALIPIVDTPLGSALTVDSTATDGSALTHAVTPSGSALVDPANGPSESALTETLNTSDGSVLANPVSVDVAPNGSAISGSALAVTESGYRGSALALNNSKAGMTDSQTKAAPKRIPGVTEPYKHVGTRERLEVALVEFMLRPNLPGLSWLHLCAGVYCSDLAKKRGIFHGLCDERGMKAESEVATHVGFTAGDEEEMED